ncbi:MAG: DUF3285 domain-containing protein [Coleofasciculaceae cyanobacterium]
MSNPSSSSQLPKQSLGQIQDPVPSASNNPPPSYVKLAMRNMVRKGGKSLYHFLLTIVGLLAMLVSLAYLTH